MNDDELTFFLYKMFERTEKDQWQIKIVHLLYIFNLMLLELRLVNEMGKYKTPQIKKKRENKNI